MTEQRPTSSGNQRASRTGRREALKRMGQYAAYTSPVLITLTLPQDAAAGKRGKGKGGRRSPRPHVSRR
jgi:hypothetical protein